MIVADASTVVDLLLGGGSEAGDSLARRLAAREVVCAPHLVDAEVGQVLRRFYLKGELAKDLAVELVTDMTQLPIRRYPHAHLLARAFELRSKVTVYDGIYLALAEALDVELLTGDAGLEKVAGCRAVVQVLSTTA